jgi:hypothetical protein
MGADAGQIADQVVLAQGGQHAGADAFACPP